MKINYPDIARKWVAESKRFNLTAIGLGDKKKKESPVKPKMVVHSKSFTKKLDLPKRKKAVYKSILNKKVSKKNNYPIPARKVDKKIADTKAHIKRAEKDIIAGKGPSKYGPNVSAMGHPVRHDWSKPDVTDIVKMTTGQGGKGPSGLRQLEKRKKELKVSKKNNTVYNKDYQDTRDKKTGVYSGKSIVQRDTDQGPRFYTGTGMSLGRQSARIKAFGEANQKIETNPSDSLHVGVNPKFRANPLYSNLPDDKKKKKKKKRFWEK